MEPQMNKQVQHVFLFLCQKPLWAQISWKPTGPRRHKFGEMHSGSRPLTDPGECPRLGSRLQLFSEQNTASASQNKADKSYTDSETDNYQRFVFCREQKEIFEERERRARALKKKKQTHRGILWRPDVNEGRRKGENLLCSVSTSIQLCTRFHFMTGQLDRMKCFQVIQYVAAVSVAQRALGVFRVLESWVM